MRGSSQESGWHVTETNDAFAQDILAGLRASPKRLPSKYFYDEVGDALFTRITETEEYYLTGAETEILAQQGEEILSALGFEDRGFDIVELGAGDGTKVAYLLEQLDHDADVRFLPVDISANALSTLCKHLAERVPWLDVVPLNLEYFDALNSIGSERPRLVLFLGSNIGNLEDEKARRYLQALSDTMVRDDKLLLGVDLKKAASIVLPAYNDKSGYTRLFNLNLLTRINRELDADFDVNAFEHDPRYDERTGITESYLVSTKRQRVTLSRLGETVIFEQGEEMQTEYSIKYDAERLAYILGDTHLTVVDEYSDRRGYFADILLSRM